MTLAALLYFWFQIRYFLSEQTLVKRYFYSGQSDNVKTIFFFLT